jgi:hypothetical protein
MSRLPNAERCVQWCTACAQRLAHHPRGSAPGPSRVWFTISMIVGTPRPSSPTMLRPGLVVLDLARRVGAIAELVLEPLDAEVVARAVGAEARHEEAAQPASVCARVRNASDIGAEQNHLCPVSRTRRRGRRPPAAGARGVGAHVRAALLLGHRHADRHAALLDRPGCSGVVLGLERIRGIHTSATSDWCAQRGHDGVGHRQRAQHAGFDLCEQVTERDVGRRGRPGAAPATAASGSRCAHRRP